ncbi:MAG: DUF1553 domain-containing protein [Gemmataceae bacterium]
MLPAPVAHDADHRRIRREALLSPRASGKKPRSGTSDTSRTRARHWYRRSLYVFWRRIVGPTMFFDSANRQTCSVKTTTTNTPLHALATLNDITCMWRRHGHWPNSRWKSGGATERCVGFAFRRATSRKPSEQQVKILVGRA